VGVHMTTTFDKREKGFEAEFVHQEELRFKAKARRDHLVGVWAAQKLGLAANDVEGYAKALVLLDVDNPGADSVFEKLRSDFNDKGLVQSDHEIRSKLDEFMKQAIADIKRA
jgi:hypothetical protein